MQRKTTTWDSTERWHFHSFLRVFYTSDRLKECDSWRFGSCDSCSWQPLELWVSWPLLVGVLVVEFGVEHMKSKWWEQNMYIISLEIYSHYIFRHEISSSKCSICMENSTWITLASWLNVDTRFHNLRNKPPLTCSSLVRCLFASVHDI